MSMCLMCNGMNNIKIDCPQCEIELIDFGRIMDYGEKYEAYEEIDLLKAGNGVENDLQNSLCPHYMTCPRCSQYSIYLVEEQL